MVTTSQYLDAIKAAARCQDENARGLNAHPHAVSIKRLVGF
jgi:hypothetical protein